MRCEALKLFLKKLIPGKISLLNLHDVDCFMIFEISSQLQFFFNRSRHFFPFYFCSQRKIIFVCWLLTSRRNYYSVWSLKMSQESHACRRYFQRQLQRTKAKPMHQELMIQKVCGAPSLVSLVIF